MDTAGIVFLIFEILLLILVTAKAVADILVLPQRTKYNKFSRFVNERVYNKWMITSLVAVITWVAFISGTVGVAESFKTLIY